MTLIVRSVGMILLLFSTTPLLSQICDCLTTGNCPVMIEDNGTFYGTLDVTVNGANDLGACPLTQVCFSITHTWVGDLSVALTSPAGVNYLLMADLDNGPGGCGNQEDNINVCIDPGIGNPLTGNTEYICNGGASGICLLGNWTMPCNGVTDPVSGAAQAPNCSLDDFNLPGNPANGTWTLTVNDICANDVGTLDNFSLQFACGVSTCTVCEAEGGSLNAGDVTSCFGDPSLNLNLPPTYGNGEVEPPAGDYSYGYVISQNGTIISVNNTADMSIQPPGTYQVCGLSYLTIAIGDVQTLIGMNLTAAQTLLSGTTAPFCADFSNDCITVIVGNLIPPTILDTFACLGECIFLENGNEMVEVCSSGDVILDSYLGCDSVITVIMLPIFVPTTFVDTVLCAGECMEIDFTLYCPPGPYIITLESYHGCDSIVTYFITEEITEAIISPNPPPALDCNNFSVLLDGSSSIPAGGNYTWLGPNSLVSNDPSIVAFDPGVYTLIVENTAVDPPCSSTTSVTITGNTAEPDLQINGTPPTICAGDMFDLDDLDIVDLNNTSPIITFHSGTPATPANELDSTIVSPISTTTYYVLGTSAGGCTDEISVTITVNSLPTADFTVTSPICLTGTSTIIYTGNAGVGATFTWNFGNGTATPGTGAGPHSVTWPTSGTKTIKLTVTENGCKSIVFTQTVMVAVPLPQPVANCNPETNSIEFTWDPVPGAVDYLVTVAIGPIGTMTSDTSYLVTGLNSGQLASIFIEAISGNACSNSSVQISCTAQDCPDVIVTIDPVADVCLDGTQTTIVLSASQTGGDGSGVFSFTGPGVNPISGTFNPNNANIGPNNILVTYEEGTCVFNDSYVINVYPQPTADFTIDPSICLDDASTIEYTGDASPDATFTWDFSGGVAVPGTGPGPHEVTWQIGGDHTVTLSVEESGCASEIGSQIVSVEVPLADPAISCDASTSSIEFSWNDIPGSAGFTVDILTGSGGVMTSDTSMLFDNLTPNTVIEIEVTANGTGPCGSAVSEMSCTANNCEPVDITIEPVDGICLDGTNIPFNLVPTITGGMGGGDLSWSGDGIVDAAAGTFDPNEGIFGENVVTALYTEGNCIYTQDFSIYLYSLPIGGFTTDAPICDGETLTVTYSGAALPGLLFTWDFGGGVAIPGTGIGPHQVTWPGSGPKTISLIVENANGCLSNVFEKTVQVVVPLVAPIISCTSTTSTVNFTWPTVTGATDYQAVVTSGQTGVFTPPNSYTFNGLSPNEEVTIELTIAGNGICPSVTAQGSCIAIDCPTFDLFITPDNGAVCISSTDMTDFELTVVGGSNTAIETWSGSGIVDPAEGIFDPAVAGIGQHVITVGYKDGNCSYQTSTIIDVIYEPTADFSATPVICVSEGGAGVAYQGNASLSANFTWDLDGGILDVNQQTISWDTPGFYTLSLMVEQDGCVSQLFTQDVEVTPELDAPDITCNSTETSVEFIWGNVLGATDFEVTVLAGANGIYTPPGNYFVDGLSPGDEVSIQVTVNGNTVCDLPVVTATCNANDCPDDLVINLTAIGPFCDDPQTAGVNLGATVIGGTGNGTGTWSGKGVANGQFNAVDAGVGQHILTYTYEENADCIYSETMTVDVLAPPTVDVGAGGVLSCIDGQTEIELGGSGSSTGSNISYFWQADFGAFPGDSTISNPIVSLPGTYTLTITNNDLGCSTSGEVVIESGQDNPMPDFTLIPISCYGNNDGAIIINSVTGGQPPYMYSLNGAPFSQTSAFLNLEPGIYELFMLDANDCENMIIFDIQQPQELNVELVVSIEGDNNVIVLGEGVTMTGVVTVPEDSLDLVQWEPAGLVSCDTCLQVTTEPIQQTTFSLTVEDNGCTDSDAITIFVSKERHVYVPNAFSPNGDNINDMFMIFANVDQAVQVKSFLVFNRWGESVYQYYDFPPNAPAYGWDGSFRGEKLNPAVFTWFAEVEFIDGSIQMFEGDVTLIK